MWILQLSDLHVPSSWRDVGQRELLMGQLVERTLDAGVARHDLAVVVCGDMTHRGDPDGYPRAAEFLTGLMSILIDFAPVLVLCPGNHDIVASDRPFEDYNRFAWKLTEADQFLFSGRQTCSKFVCRDSEFVIANSAYHGDTGFGRIDLRPLRKLLAEPPAVNRILVTHHHLIPCSYDSSNAHNCSVLRNSYEVMDLAAGKEVGVVLHGHLHLRSTMTVGTSAMAIVGAGSGGNSPDLPTFQCNLLHVELGRVQVIRSFYFLLDPAGGRLQEISN